MGMNDAVEKSVKYGIHSVNTEFKAHQLASVRPMAQTQCILLATLCKSYDTRTLDDLCKVIWHKNVR